jgi:hypothetical protein
MDPRTDLDDTGKRKFLTLPGLELSPHGRPAVASCYTYYAIPIKLHKAESKYKITPIKELCMFLHFHTLHSEEKRKLNKW